VDYQWVTGTLTNTANKGDLCHFSAEPLDLAKPLQDSVKIVQDEHSAAFQELVQPESHIKEFKLPNAQSVTAELLLPVDTSKITAETPLAIPGTTLAANLQPCATIDALKQPVDIKHFSETLSKLAAPLTTKAAATKAAADAAAEAAAADAAAALAEATAKAGEAATEVVEAAPKAVEDATAKAGEAITPKDEEDEDVAAEAISPAHSLTASLAGLAAVAAALAFQFVL
jgi:hypothetical protein